MDRKGGVVASNSNFQGNTETFIQLFVIRIRIHFIWEKDIRIRVGVGGKVMVFTPVKSSILTQNLFQGATNLDSRLINGLGNLGQVIRVCICGGTLILLADLHRNASF